MSWTISKTLMDALSSISLPEPEAESSPTSSKEISSSAPLNGKPIPSLHCAPDKMTEFSRLSRYGLTFAPFGPTTLSAEECLTRFARSLETSSWRQDSHVPTSVPPAAAKDSTEKLRGSTAKPYVLLAKFDPVSSVWRTPQRSLFEDSTELLASWPKWGM